ncbi:hypothetical protein [Micromonospora echinospora]|uniref:hypothetical protein n=1 Tax=Micromonospora echinospora TaxID=1877 RepID=UPI00366D20EE
MTSDRLLRTADPAAGWHVDPESPQAQVMLAGILATPQAGSAERSEPVPERRHVTKQQVWRRRIAFGGATAVVVGLAMSTVWSGGPDGPTAAYAVTAKPDGSVELTVRWEQLEDAGALAAKLRQAGVPTEVGSGPPTRYCAGPAERDRTSNALNKLTPHGEPASLDGYLMRPQLFPEGSSLVISTYSDRATQVAYTLLYLAPTGSTSCTISGSLGSARFTGPGPRPTHITWPHPPA